MKVLVVLLIVCVVQCFGDGVNIPPGLDLTPSQLYEIQEDAKLSTTGLIEKYGYPAETHHVKTSDGYILEMHRIPYGRKSGPAENKPVVFVQHGLLSSSADFIVLGPEKALGYMLADLGYDVWLGNARGNHYSRHNEFHNPDKHKAKFWNFSWHEIGTIDLPAMIDYVLAKSGQEKLHYIGHSQGTTVFYVMCSEKPEYNDKIKAMFSLAPVAYMKNIISPLMLIQVKFLNMINILTKLIGLYEFMPNNEIMQWAGETFCNDDAMTQFLCTNTLFVLCGFNRDNLNTTLLPVLMGHTPAGAATKQIIHYGQEINSGKFRRYDFGLLNLFKYGQLTPPKYDLSKITAPVALHYSKNDWMAAETDVMHLYEDLPNSIGHYEITGDDKFNHLDFVWGINAHEILYPVIFNLMEEYK